MYVCVYVYICIYTCTDTRTHTHTRDVKWLIRAIRQTFDSKIKWILPSGTRVLRCYRKAKWEMFLEICPQSQWGVVWRTCANAFLSRAICRGLRRGS